MLRFSRLTAYRQTANVHTNPEGTLHQNRQRRQRKWSAVLFCAVIAAAASASTAPGPALSQEESLVLQGHAKRYMRINEYLFHGTQKTTAVA